MIYVDTLNCDKQKYSMLHKIKEKIYNYSLYRQQFKVTLRAFIQIIIVKNHDNKKNGNS